MPLPWAFFQRIAYRAPILISIINTFEFFFLRGRSFFPHESLHYVEGHLTVNLVLKAVEGFIEQQGIHGDSTTESNQVRPETFEDAREAFQDLFGVEIVHIELANFEGAVKGGNLVGMEHQILADLVKLGLAWHFDLNIQAPEVFLNSSVHSLHSKRLPGGLELEDCDES